MPPATNTIGLPFIELPSIDSTNNYAIGLVHEGMAQHGMAVFTYHQTKGKGQRGKQWLSESNQNIAISIIIEPYGLVISQLFVFNMAIALSCHRFFSRNAGSEITIKWPNDIYWCDRKAGGILIENILQGQTWRYAIAGIGMNINQTIFEKELELRAASLRQITGKQHDTAMLAKELCTDVDFYFNQLLNEPKSIIQQYQQHLYKLNKEVRLKKGNRIFQTTIKGINAVGQLITQNVAEELFAVGEVEWLL